MEEVNNLIGLSRRFVGGETAADQFSEEFIGRFFDHEDEIYEHDQRVHSLLDEIRSAAARFEPNEAIRAEERDYINAAQLQAVVRQVLDQLPND